MLGPFAPGHHCRLSPADFLVSSPTATRVQFGPGAVLQHSCTPAPLIEDDEDEDDFAAPGERIGVGGLFITN